MRGLRRRRALMLTSGLIGFWASVAGVNAQSAEPTCQFDIPAETLDQALTDFSQAASRQIIYQQTSVHGKTAPALHGRYTPTEALRILLAGTDLRQNTNSAGVLVVQPKNVQAASDEGAAQSPAGVETVIVTAEKRTERLQDAPVPVSVIDAQALVSTNQMLMRDWFSSVPGLSLSPAVQSIQILSIRGIGTGVNSNPTVGITIDDVPFGASQAAGGGQEVPDLDPSDLSSIEVLRGPQGTLYGASSMGGLIKFVTVDPSTEGVSGNLQAGVSSVENGAEPGYSFRGSVNVPLSDDMAFRASGFTRLDPGYIDNPVLGINGINAAHADGGLFSYLWRPDSGLSLKIVALLQNIKGNGSSDIDTGPGLSGLEQDYIRGTGGYNRNVQAYSANLKAQLGDVALTSITGYNVNGFSDSFDFTSYLAQYTQAQFGVTGTPVFEHNWTDKFSQEVRFSGTVWQNFDWLLGFFYTHESSQWLQAILAENTTTGAIAGEWEHSSAPSTTTENAVFADMTYHVTDRFDVQLGARSSRINETAASTITGVYDPVLLGESSPVVEPTAHSQDSPFTYLLTPRYRFSPDLMVYARLASGYRAGGANYTPGVPRQYNPDTTKDYEIGVKGDLFDHRLSFDASLYYIDWKDLQLSLVQVYSSYTGNGGAAKSQGAEFSVDANPWDGMSISAWTTWTDAELTENLPAASTAYGLAGSRLPFSSRFSGNLSMTQEFPVTDRWTGSVGGALSYIGDRLADFGGTAQRQNLPGFSRLDLHAGLQSGSWTVNLYANNVTDTRGLLNGGVEYLPPSAFQYIQPRTIGMNISKSF